MRNIKTNHSGWAAVNLYLKNMMTMNRYYLRHRGEIEYPIHWKRRIIETIKAALIGWEFHNLRTEKGWLKKFETGTGRNKK